MLRTLFILLVLFIQPVLANTDCPPVLKHLKRMLNSQQTVNLCHAYRGKAILFVNTASYCHFTPQYDGLEALYNDYKEQGLVVLGFPSHDFNQEDADEANIAKLCKLTYGVNFPMFEPVNVKGDDADALFKQLAKATGIVPRWNFYKYLMAKNGRIIKAYSSISKPWDDDFRYDIESALAQE